MFGFRNPTIFIFYLSAVILLGGCAGYIMGPNGFPSTAVNTNPSQGISTSTSEIAPPQPPQTIRPYVALSYSGNGSTEVAQ